MSRHPGLAIAELVDRDAGGARAANEPGEVFQGAKQWGAGHPGRQSKPDASERQGGS
jgi:hypothetical protein